MRLISAISKAISTISVLSVCAIPAFSQVKPVDIAKGKVAKATSVEGKLVPGLAFDGINFGQGSRWGTNYTKDPKPDSGWIFVDLGSKMAFDSLAIYWEHSGAKKYDVQTWESEIDTPSYTDVGWKTFYTDTSLYYDKAKDACLRFTRVTPQTARYVRIRGYKRLVDNGISFGYSIFEFEIYNTGKPLNVAPKHAKQNLFQMQQNKQYISFTTTNSNHLDTKLKVVSSDGSLIYTAENQNSSVITWKYQNQENMPVKNGTYFAILQSKGLSEQRQVFTVVTP